MFLTNLSQEEKDAFLVLAKNMALSNNQVDEIEQALLEAFMHEMSLTETPDESISFEMALGAFDNSSNTVKRAVYVELLSLCMSNANYDDVQKELMAAVKSGLGMPNDIVSSASEWVSDMMEVTQRGYALVHSL